jgi:CspA family cold shock protein
MVSSPRPGQSCQKGKLVRERGHVQWFKSDEGVGQIVSDQSGDELFVHFSFVVPSGEFRALSAGQRVEFTREIGPGPSGPRAIAQSVVVVSSAS